MKKHSKILWMEAILFGGLSIFLYFIGKVKETYELVSMPFELLGKGLRTLSLYSAAGNVAAMLLFTLISLLPIILYIPIIKKRRKAEPADGMLLLLSGYLGFCLYAFINPDLIASLFREGLITDDTSQIGKCIVSMLFYLLFTAWGIMQSLRGMKPEHQKQGMLVKRMQRLLAVLAYLYTGVLAASESVELAKIITRKVAEGKEMTKLYAFVFESLNVLPSVLIIYLLVKGMELANELKREKYSKETVEAANALSKAGKVAVYASLLSMIGINALQLVLANKLSDVKFVFAVPIMPLVVAYVFLLLANYFRESNQLYEDKQMII